jgi:hypothetical protein
VGASKSSLSSLHASTFFSATCCGEKKRGQVNAIALTHNRNRVFIVHHHVSGGSGSIYKLRRINGEREREERAAQ